MKKHWKNLWLIKKSMKKGEKLRSIYKHYINKQDEIKKSTQFKVEEVFGNINPKYTISPKQIIKLNNFLTKIMWM